MKKHAIKNEVVRDDETVKLNVTNSAFEYEKENKKNELNKKNNNNTENNDNIPGSDFDFVDEREKERWERQKKRKKDWADIAKELKGENVEEEVL
jgi:hypothetical protein